MCLTFWRVWGILVTILHFGATANAAELPNPRGRFALWLFHRRAIESLEGLPVPSLAEAKSLRAVRSLDNGSETMVIYEAVDGTPEVSLCGDARDVAEG